MTQTPGNGDLGKQKYGVILYAVLHLKILEITFVSLQSLSVSLAIICCMRASRTVIVFINASRSVCRLTRLSLPVVSIGLRFGQCVPKFWQRRIKKNKTRIKIKSNDLLMSLHKLTSTLSFAASLNGWLKNENRVYYKM